MKKSIVQVCGEKADSSQITSWEDCFDVLQEQLQDLAAVNPNVYIIFEYVLRYTSKKRPDVLLLAKDSLVILEFKRKKSELLTDRVQTEDYARKLFKFHNGCRTMKSMVPALVLSYLNDFKTYKSGIANIVARNHVAEIVSILKTAVPLTDPMKWINALYAETPTVVEYSRAKKNGKKLPEYEVVRKAGIADAEECIHAQVKETFEQKKHIVAFVNGVPGSGKTLLGVDLAYDIYNEKTGIFSTFMSGNGPLVAVLQDALDDTFIKNIHVYLDQYTDDGAEDFRSNVCIFDEGQRTWTAKKRKSMIEKRLVKSDGIAKRTDMSDIIAKKKPDMSEAQLFIEMVDARVDWCFLLVLIGDGQEIYSGEVNGIQLWMEAIKQSKYKWEVLCPPSMDKDFSGFTIVKDDRREKLTLKNTLRNGSDHFSAAVNKLVMGDIDDAK